MSEALNLIGALMPLQKSFSLLVTLFILAGCVACGASKAVTSGAPATAEVLVDNEFELAPGQTATIAALALTLRFDSVGNDSRCPHDVTCVWAGNAALLVTIKRGGAIAHQVTLNSFSEPRSVKVGNDTLTLVGLLPEADSRHPIAPGDYRARLVVRSGS